MRLSEVPAAMLHRVAQFPLFRNRVPSLDALRAAGQWRHLPTWYASRQPDYLLRHGIPWLTFDAIAWLRDNVPAGLRVFEYGGGASTIFWAKARADVVTIEHDAEWVAHIRQWLPPDAQATLHAVAPDANPPSRPLDPSDADDYTTDWAAFAGQTFRDYVTQIDPFEEETFDVVVIDGQARPSCLKHSWSKVRRGGKLIFDNANWAQYQPCITRYLEGWERLRFVGLAPIDGALAETDVFIRPPSTATP